MDLWWRVRISRIPTLDGMNIDWSVLEYRPGLVLERFCRIPTSGGIHTVRSRYSGIYDTNTVSRTVKSSPATHILFHSAHNAVVVTTHFRCNDVVTSAPTFQ